MAKPGPLASFASRRGKTRAHALQDLLVRENRVGGREMGAVVRDGVTRGAKDLLSAGWRTVDGLTPMEVGTRGWEGQHLLVGTGDPQLTRRNCRVERFIPRRMAAPFGPPSTQFVSSSAARMCLHSASSRVSWCLGLTLERVSSKRAVKKG